MDYKTYVYEATTRKIFEDFKKAAVNLKMNILSDNKKTIIYDPRSIYLRLIELKSIPMQCGWHGKKEGDDMAVTVTNEHLRNEFDNFEKNGDFGNLLEELRFSRLIVPVECNGKGFAMIEMKGETYIPIFTDIHEYHKVHSAPVSVPKHLNSISIWKSFKGETLEDLWSMWNRKGFL